MNERGAYIGKRQGYITKQNHDAIKVSGGFWKGMGKDPEIHMQKMDDWIKFISPLLHEETFARVDEWTISRLEKVHGDISNVAKSDVELETARNRQNFMEEIWKDIVLGRHGAGELSDLDANNIPAGLANKLSKERVLHFKDADNWLKYHREFGSGSIS